ncbi:MULTISPECIES: nicotine blue oxidoreductase [Arthrobacter]|uniref:Nucleotidyltransferase family protein n=1 Tax=Arthrobacter terricola TaxID=2547396 RepID=A0A4R5KSV0_9MICC|nr:MULTISPECIES: nucleotidyltransferase family protein [Arthrobacter]MBT8160784.1 nucleotidyltransferase family protein [Arthrobacter sp. GN70]TDF97927.1 nucleotidyltransferase family protein [Arthrobacter terricola]
MENTVIAPVTGVLLAAGAGTRLGLGPKALLPFRGRTLVEVLAKELLDGGCRHVVVVLGADSDGVRRATGMGNTGQGSTEQDGCRVIDNPDWSSGMASSFRAGLAAADPGHHVLVALVDQPGLTSAVVARLMAAHRPGRVTAAGYAEPEPTPTTEPRTASTPNLRRGHPLVIDATLRAAAAEAAEGDAGARLFLKAHPEFVDLVDCSDLTDGADLDTKDQLHLLGD